MEIIGMNSNRIGNSTGGINMEKKIEYAIAAVTTDKVFPKVFITEEEADKFKSYRPDPSHWKVVSREVTYSEWK